MSNSHLARIESFENRLTRAQATAITDLPWGFAVLQAEFPLSRDHNKVVVELPAPASDVLAAAEDTLGRAGRPHRHIAVNNDAVGLALGEDFEAVGFEHETVAAMIYTGQDPGPNDHEVVAVSLEVVRPAIVRDWRLALPGASEEQIGQLADRTELYARGAELTHLALFEGGEIAAHATVHIDRPGGIAQFENLVTGVDFRGRGYANAMVLDGFSRGREAGCDLSFLTAGVNDWPYQWYRRLGYVEVARTHHFSRSE